MNGAAWRAVLRIARRDVLRAKGRSALVVTMIGLPVAATVGLSTLLATAQVDELEAVPARMGTGQALIEPFGRSAVFQDAGATSRNWSDEARPDGTSWTAAEVERHTGGRALVVRRGQVSSAEHDRLRTVSVVESDLTDPVLRPTVTLLEGRVPRARGEVTASPAMQRDGVRVGDRLRLRDGEVTATVVGVARSLYGSDTSELHAYPGTVLRPDASQVTYVLDRPTPVLWPQVRELNQAGLIVVSRAVLADPPPTSEIPQEVHAYAGGMSPETQAVVVIAVVAIVLEVVLLAGPAFAVGVRRQRRQLALLSAAGATARDVRRAVLAQGVVLGVGAALGGGFVGLAAAPLAVPLLRRVSGTGMGPYDVVPSQVIAATVIGAVAAVLAAWVPARQAARLDVVAALAGRRGTVRSRRGAPLAGGVVALVGAAVAVQAAFGSTMAEVRVAAGTVVMVLGTVVLMPSLVGLVGRLSTRWPLPLRLAARDASRQRGRTAPAVAAVMGAVAGITALAVGSASDFAQERRDYLPTQVPGTTVISLDAPTEPGADTQLAGIQAATARALEGRRALPVGTVAVAGPTGTDVPTEMVLRSPGCPRLTLSGQYHGNTPAEARCDPSTSTESRVSLVADAEAVRALGIALSQEQERLLASGGVLVAAERYLHDDGTVMAVMAGADKQGRVSAPRDLPPLRAATVDLPRHRGIALAGATVILTPRTADRLALPWYDTSAVLDRGPALSVEDQERLAGALPLANAESRVLTERGFQATYTVQLLVLIGAALVTVLVGTLTATALALADARPDLATLAAVGARPRTRRLMGGAQALLIGVLGAGTGIAVGFVPGWAVSRPLTSSQPYAGADGLTGSLPPVLDVPWLLLLTIGLAVPALAALVALVGTRSRLPMVRRIG